MRTVKLVVIGASGVGKSSIRNQYISGRFTTGYRATIGADFITKTLSHYSCPDELVTLQIWDTAGQERFSGLSSAFFRGADAVILMFDVNQPQTLTALTKWWDDFRDKAPVPDDIIDEFCCVVVGNKIDVPQGAGARTNGSSSRGGALGVVTEAEARDFIHTLVPHPSTPPSPSIDLVRPDARYYDEEDNQGTSHLLPEDLDDSQGPKTDSIDIAAHPWRGRTSHASRSRSRSTLFRGGGTAGTVTTTHSIYHTPSSSLFDTFQSALSSPAFTAFTASASRSPSHSPLRSPRRIPSNSSVSSAAPTITPSLFVRGHGDVATTATTTPESGSPPTNGYTAAVHPPLERYPKLFFTSAKTGEGVREVFEYVARRVVRRREHEEALEARTMHIREATLTSVRDSVDLSTGSGLAADRRFGGSCCRV